MSVPLFWRLRARSLAPLVKARGFGMTHLICGLNQWFLTDRSVRPTNARAKSTSKAVGRSVRATKNDLGVEETFKSPTLSQRTRQGWGTQSCPFHNFGAPRELPRPAGESAGLRDDAPDMRTRSPVFDGRECSSHKCKSKTNFKGDGREYPCHKERSWRGRECRQLVWRWRGVRAGHRKPSPGGPER